VVDEQAWLSEQFEGQRPHLRSVAYRMLGSSAEADDAVQEAWIRLNRSDASAIENLGGWLTTVVGRVCLDMLRSRTTRREDPLEAPGDAVDRSPDDPEHEALVADSVGLALLVVLETLTPAERVAFVLHDTFGVPFDEIAAIVGRSPEATRQLASRARRRVRGAADGTTHADVDPERRRQIVAAFLAAAHSGDFDALVAVLDPDIVVRADAAAEYIGAPKEVRGTAAVAGMFSGRARAARAALIDGEPGLVWRQRGRPAVVFLFDVDVADGIVTAIDMVADPDRLSALEIELLA
jgi:RNA polymerase sigma-70 factor, ECF subfamily